MPAQRSTRPGNLAWRIAVLAAIWAPDGHAAGGHFAVDDAAILDVGTCQIETWWERVDHGGSLLHLGPACRLGPLELAVNADRIQPRDGAPQTPVGPQVKWAMPIGDRVSVGLSAQVAWQGSAPRYAGATLYAPLTLRLADSLWLNVNVGQDWLRDRPSRGRSGASLEWKATPAWTLIGERFRQFGDDFARLGVRWQQSRSFGVDLGRAAALGAGSVRTWTLGANWTFDAPGSTPRPP
jgi:hypothetical protein